MSFIQREQGRIVAAMAAASPTEKRELWLAQQALAWASDPTQFAAPCATIMGTSEVSADCRADRGPPQSLCSDGHTD